MKDTCWSIADSYPNINPFVEFIDNRIKEQLFFLPAGDSLLCVLNRPVWQMVNDPEPGFLYSAWVLEEAMSYSINRQCNHVFVYNCDKAKGIGYIVPIGRIWALGSKEEHGRDMQIMLPLRYWDVRHRDGTTTCVPLPNPTGKPLGVWMVG